MPADTIILETNGPIPMCLPVSASRQGMEWQLSDSISHEKAPSSSESRRLDIFRSRVASTSRARKKVPGVSPSNIGFGTSIHRSKFCTCRANGSKAGTSRNRICRRRRTMSRTARGWLSALEVAIAFTRRSRRNSMPTSPLSSICRGVCPKSGRSASIQSLRDELRDGNPGGTSSAHGLSAAANKRRRRPMISSRDRNG